MERKCILSAIFLLIPCLLYAQTCFEGTGQTVAFTLQAGAKAGWNSSVPIIEKPHTFSNGSISLFVFSPSNDRIAFRVTGLNPSVYSKIAIFSVTGQRIHSVVPYGKTQTVLFKNLAKGIYFARLEANGKTIKTTRFMVGR